MEKFNSASGFGKVLLACALFACTSFVAAPAQTTPAPAPAPAPVPPGIEQRIERLEKMIDGLQDELLKTRREMNRAAAEKEKGAKGVVKTDGKEDITVSTAAGGFNVKSDNGNSFRFGGRLLFDYDFFDDVFTGNGESQSEGEWRRTRLTASGSVKKDWKYKLTVNIDDADEAADVNTAYVEYAGFKPLAVRVGKFKEPFSLERMTSSKWLSTIERNMTLDFLGGNLGAGEPDLGGVQLSGYHKDMSHLNWAIGVFDDGSEDEDGQDNYSVTGRVALAPHFGEDHFLHLGAAFSVREIEGRVGYRSRLGVHTADGGRPTLAAAWVDDVEQYGLETAYVNGAFSLQAEYIDVTADGDTGRAGEDGAPLDGTCTDANDDIIKCGDIDFDGYYLQGAYTLTGETRSYKTKGAVFDKVKPGGAMGAWELVARYEDVDVDDDNEDRSVGAEKWILGVNWYANNNLKFMLNYLDAEVDEDLAADQKLGCREDSTDPDVCLETDDSGEAWSLRAQYVF